MSRQGVESATSRVQRLLTMVPWLVSRQGIEISAAAAGLGISEEQLTKDLDLLFMCGYGQMPDEMIEASYEGGRVFVSVRDTDKTPEMAAAMRDRTRPTSRKEPPTPSEIIRVSLSRSNNEPKPNACVPISPPAPVTATVRRGPPVSGPGWAAWKSRSSASTRAR